MPINKIKFIFGIIGMAVSITSCINTKQLVYFQQADSTNAINQLMKMATPPISIIEPNDLLAISIVTYDQESNTLLNYPNTHPIITTTFPGQQSTANLGQPLSFEVDSLGNVDIPIIGKQHLGGLTISKAKIFIASQLLTLYKEPHVDIRFLNRKFTVMGEVNKVGTYNLLNDPITLPEALAAAGDLTIYGRRDNVLLIRNRGDGEKEMVRINLLTPEIIESPYFYIQNGDVLYIEPLKGKVTNTDYRIQLIPIITGVVTTLVIFLNVFAR